MSTESYPISEGYLVLIGNPHSDRFFGSGHYEGPPGRAAARLASEMGVHRARANDDRREVLLALTPRGEKVLGELALHHQDELRSAGPELVSALRRVMRESGDGSAPHEVGHQAREKVK